MFCAVSEAIGTVTGTGRCSGDAAFSSELRARQAARRNPKTAASLGVQRERCVLQGPAERGGARWCVLPSELDARHDCAPFCIDSINLVSAESAAEVASSLRCT